jgi:hypothetical protein
MLLLLFSAFPLFIYPHIKSAWGGGASVDVVLYLSKDSAVLPNSALRAQLLDESDGGYYIVIGENPRAIYLPRASVAAAYFSDKPLDPSYLSHQH